MQSLFSVEHISIVLYNLVSLPFSVNREVFPFSFLCLSVSLLRFVLFYFCFCYAMLCYVLFCFVLFCFVLSCLFCFVFCVQSSIFHCFGFDYLFTVSSILTYAESGQPVRFCVLSLAAACAQKALTWQIVCLIAGGRLDHQATE